MVAVGTAQESDSAPSLNRAYRVGVASEESLAPTPTIKQPARFIFPQEGKFNAFSILRPHWRLAFSHSLTGEEAETYADEHFQEPHADPVTLSRFAELPSVYLNRHQPYRIKVLDEFRIERHRINYFLWPDTVKNLLNVGAASENNEALEVTAEKGASTVNVGVATESDKALSLVTEVQVGVATETDTAPPRGIAALFDGRRGLWLSAQDLETGFQDEAGTTPAEEDDPIGLRTDKSGNNTDVSQSTDSARPILRAETLNGETVYYDDGDGDDDFLSADISEFDLSTPWEMFALVRNMSADTSSWLSVGEASAGEGSLGDGVTLGTNSNGDLKIASNGVTPGEGSAVSTTEPVVVGVRWDGTDLTARLGGVDDYSVTPTGAIDWSAIDTFSLFKRVTGSGGIFASRSYAALLFADSLSASERDEVEQHLADIAGITL